MRYIMNSQNYVTHISFGCPLVVNGQECKEYTGGIPTGYSNLEEWYTEEELSLWRWKIINGSLTLDPNAKMPEEGKWGVPDLQSKTVTPTKNAQIVTPDEEYDGLDKVTVNGDGNLLPENIKSEVKIFGVYGSLLVPELVTGIYTVADYTSDSGEAFTGIRVEFPEDAKIYQNQYILAPIMFDATLHISLVAAGNNTHNRRLVSCDCDWFASTSTTVKYLNGVYVQSTISGFIVNIWYKQSSDYKAFYLEILDDNGDSLLHAGEQFALFMTYVQR